MAGGIYDLFSPNVGGINKGYKALAAAIPQAGATLTGAEQKAAGTLTAAQQDAINALMGGQTQGAQAIQGGITPWQELMSQFQPVAQTYFGAAEGTPQGQQAWQQSPEYQFLQDQIKSAVEGVSRTYAPQGQLGALTTAATEAAAPLFQSGFGQYLSSLAPAISGEQTAASGIQSGQNALANLFAQGGAQQAGVYTGTGADIAGLQTGLGSDIANLQLGAGGLPLQRAQAINQAKQTAGSNALSAIFGLLGAGTGLASAFRPAPSYNFNVA